MAVMDVLAEVVIRTVLLDRVERVEDVIARAPVMLAPAATLVSLARLYTQFARNGIATGFIGPEACSVMLNLGYAVSLLLQAGVVDEKFAAEMRL